MKLKVTNQGVLIPKELLGDSQEVELTQQEGKLIITIHLPALSYEKATEYVLEKNHELYQRLA
jgi:virulence-associated protein VagC